MKFTLNIVAMPLLSLLLATMALTAPMRGDETIRDALPVSGPISERAAAPAAMVGKRFRFTREDTDALNDDLLRAEIHEALCVDNGIQLACQEEAEDEKAISNDLDGSD